MAQSTLAATLATAAAKTPIPIVKSKQTTVGLIRRYIVGTNIEVDEDTINNMPEWFIYVIIIGSLLCCISFVAWMCCALFFFKKERKCTHTVTIVVDETPSKPTRSPKRHDDEPPVENGRNENDPATNDPLASTEQGNNNYAPTNRSSKRSSRKEDGASSMKKSGKSSSKSPDSRKSSKKSSKKSQKSGKSDRIEGGKDKECVIQIDHSRLENDSVGFFEKISRAVFFSRDF
ncbi:unnamed protein product [Caenorhabditis brenneri]